MSSWQELVKEVKIRAGSRCEYCRLHQSLQGATFHTEHVIPDCQGGVTDLSNLALACPSCNLHKSDRTSVIDPITGQSVPLFNPRGDAWTAHFAWNGYEVKDLTDIGRATIHALEFNHPRKLRIRQAEELFGLFPPAS